MEIGGYTDSTGTEQYNMALSEKELYRLLTILSRKGYLLTDLNIKATETLLLLVIMLLLRVEIKTEELKQK